MQQWEYRAVNIHTRHDLVTYETVMNCGQAIKIEDSHADDSSKAAEGARALHYHICYLNHLGQEGWEVINVQPGESSTTYTLKRPLIPPGDVRRDDPTRAQIFRPGEF